MAMGAIPITSRFPNSTLPELTSEWDMGPRQALASHYRVSKQTFIKTRRSERRVWLLIIARRQHLSPVIFPLTESLKEKERAQYKMTHHC